MADWKFDKARDLNLSSRERHRSPFREGGLVETILRFVWWSCVRISLRGYHRIVYRGQEHLPTKPSFIIAANHESHLDALLIGAGIPLSLRDQMFPLAAGDVFFEVPAAAAFSAWTLNALPVWRKSCGKQGLHDLRERLINEGCVYILFPEGTRTRNGEMAKFRSGIGMLVSGTSVPVIPCFIRGAFQAFPPRSRFPRPHKISVTFGAALKFPDIQNKRTGWDTIAAATELAVLRLNAQSKVNSDGRTRQGDSTNRF